MIISGHLLEVGIINANKWGIPAAGAAELLESLPGKPLKICEDRAHACDFNPSTKKGSTIGKILSASKQGNKVSITAEVSDSGAAYRILHNRYPRNWSLFTAYKTKDSNSMLTGAEALAVSLVSDPAYLDARYSILPEAAAAIDLTPLEKYYQNPRNKPVQMGSKPTLEEALQRLHNKYKGN